MGGAIETAQWVGLILSPVFLVGVLAWKLTLDIIDCRMPLRRSRVNSVLIFSAGLLFSVWALRFSVGCYMTGVKDTDVAGFHWLEVLGDGFLHALQTFSMDEDYTGYISHGKDMMQALTGSQVWSYIYSGYAAVLNAVAPVIGGAFILDILASVFPGMRLWLSYKLVWREKLFFSELTDASLALAKSMWKESHVLCRPVIVFTDAYTDDEDERKSERRLEAKMLGAICVKDDLAHVPKNRFGKRSFFLIDENESNNLQTLVDLCDGGCDRYVRKAKIFLFVESDGYVQVERRVRSQLKARLQACKKEQEFPDIVPVNSNRNLACNLLVELPLYEPLVKSDKKELHVAIFGENSAAQEMLLAAYWFGQILDRKLRIDVVAEAPEEDFWSNLDYINPEIKKTLDPENDILYYNKKACAEPYGDIRYVQASARHGSFWDEENQTVRESLNADYLIVALDSDADNLAVAEKLQTVIGEAHVKQKGSQRAVIAYMVRNARLCETLNEKRCICNLDPRKPDVYAHAFGSLKELYSRENIFLTRHAIWASGVGEAYSEIQRQTDSLQDNRTRTSKVEGDYKYWSDMARAMHIKYKVFSLGWIESSVFEDNSEDKTAYRNEVQKACATFRRIATGDMLPEDSAKADELEKCKHRMAWLEHRRWNANLRVRGFRCTKDYKTYFQAVGNSYKHMDLKLHPCLVECDQHGMRSAYDEKEKVFVWQDQENFDRLDQLSKKLIELGYNNYDFKKYDYSCGEFS